MLKKKVDGLEDYYYQWMNKYKDDADSRLVLLRRLDKEMEIMYRLKIIYPASLGDLWTDIVSELAEAIDV